MRIPELAARNERQTRAMSWGQECFGDNAMSPHERALRFLEEALELVQASGVTPEEVLKLRDYTYSRPVGEIGQEVGGVCITLMVLCEANNISLAREELREFDRVIAIDPDVFRAKHAAKIVAGIST